MRQNALSKISPRPLSSAHEFHSDTIATPDRLEADCINDGGSWLTDGCPRDDELLCGVPGEVEGLFVVVTFFYDGSTEGAVHCGGCEALGTCCQGSAHP